MKKRSIIYLASAKADLRFLIAYLAQEVSPVVAKQYVARVQKRIASLGYAAERGTIRNAETGLRVIGILPNTSVAFVVTDDTVHILRVLQGGQTFDED